MQPIASGPSGGSTYFNPALLTDADDELLVGFAVISEQVGITLDGRRGVGQLIFIEFCVG